MLWGKLRAAFQLYTQTSKKEQKIFWKCKVHFLLTKCGMLVYPFFFHYQGLVEWRLPIGCWLFHLSSFRILSMHLAWQGLCPIFPGLGSISSTLERVVTPDTKTCVGPCSEAKVAQFRPLSLFKDLLSSGLPPFLLPHQAYHPKQPQHWQPV